MDRLIQAYHSVSQGKRYLLATLALVILLYSQFESEVVPSQDELEFLQDDRARLHDMVEALQVATANLETLESQLGEARSEMEGLEGRLPTKPQTELTLMSLTEASQLSGTSLEDFRPSLQSAQSALSEDSDAADAFEEKTSLPDDSPNLGTKETKAIAEVTESEVLVEGRFRELVSFFEALLTQDRLLQVKSFDISVPDEEKLNFDTDRVLLLSATVQSYSQKRQETPRKPEPGNSSPAPSEVSPDSFETQSESDLFSDTQTSQDNHQFQMSSVSTRGEQP